MTAAADRENVADVICIGAQKAGTSWLHYLLQIYPDVYSFPNMAPVTSTNKEAHFWDWNRRRGVEWYRQLLLPPRPEMLTMDFTPEYALLSPAQIAECKALNPTARIIYILRNPLERALSALRMYRRMSGSRAPIAMDSDTLQMIERHAVLPHSNYAANYRRWHQAYPGRILVLNYRDILLQPRIAHRRVAEFLQMPRLETWKARRRLQRRIRSRIWAGEAIRVDRTVVDFLDSSLAAYQAEAEACFKISLSLSTFERMQAQLRRALIG